VIAIDNAGPKETIEHSKTGFLLANNSRDWSEKMRWMVEREDDLQLMRKNCQKRMLDHFEFKSFQKKFIRILLSLTEKLADPGKVKTH